MASGRPSRWRHRSAISSGSARNVGSHRDGPFVEQLACCDLVEWIERQLALPGDVERLAARSDDAKVGAGLEEEAGRAGHDVDDVLAVVEDDDDRARSDSVGHPDVRRSRRLVRRPGVVSTERRRDLLRHGERI